MADGISIPGVTDKYKTNDLVESLMEVERVPLKREQANLEKYQSQQSAWRDVNQRMSSLRESVKTLYSFENPFNNKLASSSDENAITVDAGRDADYGSFKIDVVQPATADRFLSGEIDRSMTVEAGKYKFTIGEKTIDFNWKGGKLSDFVTALNKRGNGILKASLIGVSANKKSLLLESTKTGEENHLVFEEKALEFATQIDMVSAVKSEAKAFSSNSSSFKTVSTSDFSTQQGMPPLSKNGVSVEGDSITLPARTGVELPIPSSVKDDENQTISFSLSNTRVQDITEELNSLSGEIELPEVGSVSFRGVTVYNEQSETTLPDSRATQRENLSPITDDRFVFVKNADGTEEELLSNAIKSDEDGNQTVTIQLKDYPNATGIVLRNSNTGKNLQISVPQAYNSAANLGYAPNHAISSANDAVFKYEGITITRPSNDIDDVIPNITLHLHEKTERTATININPDKESAKDALITFVGKYNQVLAELNILTSNKPEIITELDYLSKDEQDAEKEKLGMFMGDFTLTNGKSQLQRIITSSYRYSEDTEISLLSQLGISTNAHGGSTNVNASQMRGYLEIDEKKLDEALEGNLDEIKSLFGYDSDGDLIVDSGIGFAMDKQLTSWVQTGGIIASKNASLESQIKTSNTKITRLQTQLDDKEAQLKNKYATMEGTLNSLESQQTTITNFTNANSNNNK